MPVPTVRAHSDPAESVAPFAVKTSAAVAVPLADAATVKVVVPHPLADGVCGLERVVSGMTKVIESLISKFAFSENKKRRDVAASVLGFNIVKELVVIAVSDTAVDSETYVEMSFAPANETSINLVLRFAACAVALVVTPVATVTVQ